jgi:hypothetical protein
MPELNPSHVAEAFTYLRGSAHHVFGADTHDFRLNPRLDESVVTVFEQTHQVALPSDFRNFLTSIGNGGAGPFYGIFPLGHTDDGFDLRVWKEGDVGILSQPFRFEKDWNDLNGKPTNDLLNQDEIEYWKQMEDFERAYWRTDLINGAFHICHQGCALRILLVVTGNQAGYLWDDKRSEGGGLKPVRLADGSPATFSSWYSQWLENCLGSFNSPRH